MLVEKRGKKCPGGKDRKWAPRECRAKPGGWVLLWSRPSYKHQAYQPPQLPDRGEVQTGGMSRAEATPCQRNPCRFSLAQYHPLWPTPRARVTLKAHCEQVELENGVSLTFPLQPPESLLYILFLGPRVLCFLASPYTQSPGTEKLSSFPCVVDAFT